VYVGLSDWLAVVDREYLRDFISQGGSAVKFAVVSPSLEADSVRSDLARLAGETGCLYSAVDATTTKLHMIDQFFFAVARQIDWDDLARRRGRQPSTTSRLPMPTTTANQSCAGMSASS
jgi:hypothetical protein